MNKLQTVVTELLKRDRRFFSLAQVVRETGLPRDEVRDILLSLRKEGHLVRIRKSEGDYTRGKGPPLQNVRYRVTLPSKLAERIAPKYRGENTACDRMWFIIRKKKIFTRGDLRVLVAVKDETVRHFTKMLHRAGIIGYRGRGEWVLYKNTGPRRPYVGNQKKRVH